LSYVGKLFFKTPAPVVYIELKGSARRFELGEK